MLIPPVVFSSVPVHNAGAMLRLVTLCPQCALGPGLFSLSLLVMPWDLSTGQVLSTYPTTNTCLVFFSSLQCWSELSQVESVRFPSVTLLFLLSTLCLLEAYYLHPMCFSSWGLTIYRIYLNCFCWAGLAILHVLLYSIICLYEYKHSFFSLVEKQPNIKSTKNIQ